MRQPGRAGRTTSRTRGPATRAARARIPTAASRSFPAEEGGEKRRLRPETFADHYSQARQFFVEPDRDRAAAHRRRVRVRAEQGRDGPTIRDADGRQPAQRRRGPRRGGRRRARPRPSCPSRAAAGARRRSPTCRPSPALSILAQRARHASPAASSASSSTDGVDARLLDGAARRRSSAEGATLELDRPEDRRRRRPATARSCAADQKVGGGPSVLYDAVAIVRLRATGARALADDAGGARLRHRRLRPLQVHRLRRRGHPAARGGRRRRLSTRRPRGCPPDEGGLANGDGGLDAATAQDAATLTLGRAAPDAVVDAVGERVLEALGLHRALRADAAGLVDARRRRTGRTRPARASGNGRGASTPARCDRGEGSGRPCAPQCFGQIEWSGSPCSTVRTGVRFP